MTKTRTQKSAINIVAMIMYEAVVMICNLITPRLILSAFGSSYNGITSSITQFLGFITILRAGVAGASRVALYKTLAVNDIVATSRILRATEIYLRKIAYFFLIYLLFIATFYKYLSNTDIPWIECFSLCIIIGLGTFAQYYFGLTYQTLLSADQRNYIHCIQQIGITIINTIIAVILIKLGATIQIVKLGSAGVFVAGPILLNVYVSRRYKIIKKCTPDNTALKQRKDVLGMAIANIVHDNTDIVVLTLFTDVKIVSVYAVYNLVLNGLKKILSVFTVGLEAAFGNMWAKKETAAIERNLKIYELLIFSFVSIVFPCTFVLILPFVQIYTKGITDVSYIQPLYAFFAVSAKAFHCIRMPYLTMVQAAGHYKQTRNGSFVEAGLNLILSLILVQKFSLIGVAIGTLAADIFRTIQYAKYCCDHLVSKTYNQVFQKLFWTLLNFSISISISFIIRRHFITVSWANWIMLAICTMSVACIVTLINALIFFKKDILSFVRLLRKIDLPGKKC